MNDEPASSSSNHRSLGSNNSAGPSRWADDDAGVGSSSIAENGSGHDGEPTLDGPLSPDELRQRKTEAHNRRIDCVDELLWTLDGIVLLELMTLYYMDNSFFYLLIRCLSHWLHLTPKPAIMAHLPHKPSLLALSFPNIFVTCMHLFSAPLTGSDISHGYLHGGLVIDFIGQSAPRSRFQLLGLDLLVIILQLVMFSVSIRRGKLKKRKSKQGRNQGTSAHEEVASNLAALGVNMTITHGEAGGEAHSTDDEAAVPTGNTTTDLAPERRRRNQDLDSEERGTLRRSSTASSNASLLHHDKTSSGAQDGALGEDGDDSTTRRHNDDPLASYASGQAVVLNLDIARVVRRQWRAIRTPENTGPAAQGLGRRLGRRLGSF